MKSVVLLQGYNLMDNGTQEWSYCRLHIAKARFNALDLIQITKR